MKALSQSAYGGPELIALEDVPDAVVAADDDVVIRVRACALNAADWHLMRADPWPTRFAIGMRRPRVVSPGSAVAGVVEAVGEAQRPDRVADPRRPHHCWNPKR